MQASVIVRNKNEERWIGHAIQSALEHLDKPEIIVVDNFSEDESIDIVRSFRHDPALDLNPKKYTSVKLLKLKDYTPGKAINMGVQNATFDNILVLSAHCVINSGNFDNRFEQQLNNYGCVMGKQIPIYRGKKITPRYLWSHFGAENCVNMFSDLEKRYFLHNGFCFYKRKTLIDLPIDEEISGKEDRIWACQYVSKDHKYLYDSSISCEHHYTPNGNTWKGVG